MAEVILFFDYCENRKKEGTQNPACKRTHKADPKRIEEFKKEIIGISEENIKLKDLIEKYAYNEKVYARKVAELTQENNKMKSELALTSQLLTETVRELRALAERNEAELTIDNVTFAAELTTVCWSDETYTLIEGQNKTREDKEKNLATAVFKKLAGNGDTYKQITSVWLEGQADENFSK